MSAGGYILGVVLLALIVVPLAAGAVRARARLLPGWDGAPARVAEAVMALGALVVLSELLGTAGLFHEAALIPAALAAGAAAWRWGSPSSPSGQVVEQPRRLTWAALAGCALVAVAWLERTYHAVHNGMTDSDTLWYHVPYAARWVQEGSLTGLHFTSYEPLTTFYPSTPSLLHAVPMLAFGTEFLSPYLNLGWLALAFTAGWAIGRPFGAAPATLLASALVMGTPIIVGMQAGSAKDDAPGIALVLCAVALLVNARGDGYRGYGTGKRPEVAGFAVAGLATGLLIGTKLSMVAPALALSIAAVAAAPRARRMTAGGLWAAMLFVGGGFWYLRNLAGTGNPVPWFEVNAGPLSLPSPELAPYTERYVTESVADHLGEAGFVGDYLTPSLDGAFGPAWWALLALALAGMAGALVRGGRLLRALGAAGLLMAAAYVLTPGGAGGSPEGIPHLVFWSMRYLAPALAVGLVLLPLLPAARTRQAWPVVLLAVVLLATQFAGGGFAIWDGRPPFAVLLAVPLAAVAALAWSRLRSDGLRIAAGAAAALALLAGGWKAGDVYFDNRYTDPASPLAMPYGWAKTVEHARIGIVGFYLQSPLLGEDLSNHVQYVGHSDGDGTFRSVRSCAEWRTELAEGGYDYVVTAPFNFPWGATNGVYPREARWTETDPSARRIGRDRSVAIFELRGKPDPSTCASDGFPDRGELPGSEGTGPSRPSS
ncbi:MAG TPA: hypothetical protein VF715_12740 [Thermoleophilaceae bacterium]